MLEKPDLSDTILLAHVQDQFGFPVNHVNFLPLGADVNTAVYRIATASGEPYFLKLRKGGFDETSIAVPLLLKGQGIQPIITPLPTIAGQACGNLDAYRTILYPFIEGQDGYEVALSDRQWVDFGIAMKAIHRSQIPPEIKNNLQQEAWSPHWRTLVKKFQSQVESTSFSDPTAAKLAKFMIQKREKIKQMVTRTNQLGSQLKARRMKMVLCHADLHPGNLLINPTGPFYIVDWDAPILAPKERDLMGIGMGGVWNDARQEELFYQGYAPVKLDWMALAYYRYERIIQDIAEYCKQLLLSNEGAEDREQSFQYLAGSFDPGEVVEIAFRTDTARFW
jgi:spectinomycin phosphotransferase